MSGTRRARRRFGSIRRLPSGRYQARYQHPDGRFRLAPHTFPTRTDADRFLAAVETDLHRGEWTDPDLARAQFGHWATEWLSTTTHLKPKTRVGYESMLRTHLLPRFETQPVGSISQTDVRRFLADLTADGAAAGTVRSARKVLRLVLATALGGGAIKANPCDGTRIAQSARTEKHFLTADQVERLAVAIDDRYRVMIFFAAYTGMRAGEIEALRVSRMDLERSTVDVTESVAEVQGFGLVFGPTKTYQRRTVRLPSFLCQMLADHLADRTLTPDTLVFKSSQGEPIRHRNFYGRKFKPAVARAGLPVDLRFHDLRHTCAALLIGEGAHPRAIMERLGHSSITVTLNTYGHLFPAIDEALTERLDDIYKAAMDRACHSVVARGWHGAGSA